jgi:hypothetical protein
MKKNLCLLVLAATLFTYSCKDKNYVNATIIDLGSPAADGCGFIVQMDTLHRYSPLNLADKYKVNNLEVEVDFKKEGDGFSCGFNPTTIETIKINKIKKR